MKKNALSDAMKLSAQNFTNAPQAPDPTTVLREAGEHARATIEALIDAMADIGRASDSRGYTCLVLLRGACDLARAQAHLIASDPHDMAGAAGALHRSQLDHFLRGTYLGLVADDDQLADFLANDDGIRVFPSKGKPLRLGAEALAKAVDEALMKGNLGFARPVGLADAVAKSWDTLCGLVHGGARIQELYISGGEIGCNASPEAVMATLHNAVQLTCFAIPAMWRFSAREEEAKTAAVERARNAMEEFQKAHDARQAALGIA